MDDVLQLTATGNILCVQRRKALTTGCAVYPDIVITYDNQYAGRTVDCHILSDTGVSITVPVTDGRCVMPHEVLAGGVEYIRIGLRAVGADGSVIATNYVVLPVVVGVPPDAGLPPTEPTPSVIDSLRGDISDLQDAVKDLQSSGATPEQIGQAVAQYMADNPITAADIGALTEDDLDGAIDTALASAKNSGVFDGKDGTDGLPGKDGTDGVGVASAEINADGELVQTYTDGTSQNLGRVVGTDGKDGADGLPGADGKDGADGLPGKDGADGKSAYQYAQDAGYSGTEDDFAAKLSADYMTADAVSTAISDAIANYDNDVMALLGEDGDGT